MNIPLSDIIGGSMLNLNPQHQIDAVIEDFKVFDSGGIVPDHETMWGGSVFLVSVSPFVRRGESSVSAVSVTLQNITRRKKAETDLLLAHQGLLQAKHRIEEMAHTDSLTNMPNRRSFDAAIKREIGNSRRSGTPLALAMADVDAFKSYNDIYGHLKGDKCLSLVATAISSCIRRPSDFAARYGGEEFVIILPQTELPGAIEVTNSIRLAVQGLGIEHRGNPAGVVTASFGVVGLPMVPRDMDAESARRLLLEAADSALYRAKAAGRNAVFTGSLGHQN